MNAGFTDRRGYGMNQGDTETRSLYGVDRGGVHPFLFFLRASVVSLCVLGVLGGLITDIRVNPPNPR